MVEATFRGGVNIAMKIPPQQHEAVVLFYERTLGLRVLRRTPDSVVIEYGPNRLHLDRVPHATHAEVWLEVLTPDHQAGANALARVSGPSGATRRDEVEPLPPGFRGFWIANPAGVITLVAEPDAAC